MLEQALALHAQGRLAEAEEAYRAILGREPENAEVGHQLGLLALDANMPGQAVPILERACLLAPDNPAFQANLGLAYLRSRRFAGFDEDYPPTALCLSPAGKVKTPGGQPRPFRVFGPTCDSADKLPRPLMLPDGIGNGDYILFDAMGAYTVSSRSSFNGYYPDSWAVIA